MEVVTDEIEFPTHMAFLGNNDMLILEKNEGIVKRIKNGIVQNDPLLDVAVANGGERGMLGIGVNKNKTGDVNVFLCPLQNQSRTGMMLLKEKYQWVIDCIGTIL